MSLNVLCRARHVLQRALIEVHASTRRNTGVADTEQAALALNHPARHPARLTHTMP